MYYSVSNIFLILNIDWLDWFNISTLISFGIILKLNIMHLVYFIVEISVIWRWKMIERIMFRACFLSLFCDTKRFIFLQFSWSGFNKGAIKTKVQLGWNGRVIQSPEFIANSSELRIYSPHRRQNLCGGRGRHLAICIIENPINQEPIQSENRATRNS